jgi:hypothetical protein
VCNDGGTKAASPSCCIVAVDPATLLRWLSTNLGFFAGSKQGSHRLVCGWLPCCHCANSTSSAMSRYFRLTSTSRPSRETWAVPVAAGVLAFVVLASNRCQLPLICRYGKCCLCIAGAAPADGVGTAGRPCSAMILLGYSGLLTQFCGGGTMGDSSSLSNM